MRAVVLQALAWTLLALCLACGGQSSFSGFSDGGGGGGSSSGGASSSGNASSSGGSGSGSLSGSSGGSGGSGGSDGGNPQCSGQAANYVYVLSAQNDLYSFAPNLKQFTKIGPLQCQTTFQPNSMAVDRNADAYVNYVGTDPSTGMDSAGVIYKVSTQDASCSPQPVMSLPGGYYRTGMGYSTDASGGNSETLYLSGVSAPGGTGTGLGRVDFATHTVVTIGAFTGTVAGQNAELTGTGDGRLFGFFTTMPVYVAQIDKTSGATPKPVPMNGVQTPTDWAFSFWGGHFYLYVSQGSGTTVVDYDPTTGNVNPSFMPNIGFDIVGAGVSTCAPVVPPQ